MPLPTIAVGYALSQLIHLQNFADVLVEHTLKICFWTTTSAIGCTNSGVAFDETSQ
jgi:hypothetical protein